MSIVLPFASEAMKSQDSFICQMNVDFSSLPVTIGTSTELSIESFAARRTSQNMLSMNRGQTDFLHDLRKWNSWTANVSYCIQWYQKGTRDIKAWPPADNINPIRARRILLHQSGHFSADPWLYGVTTDQGSREMCGDWRYYYLYIPCVFNTCRCIWTFLTIYLSVTNYFEEWYFQMSIPSMNLTYFRTFTRLFSGFCRVDQDIDNVISYNRARSAFVT